MIANVRSLDRAVRLVLGVVLIAGALLSGWAVFDGVAPNVAVVSGVVMLATATFRLCTLYTVPEVKTCWN